MTDGQHIVVMDELGDVAIGVDVAARQLGARTHAVHDFASLGRLLEQSMNIGVAVVAVDWLDEARIERLAVVHEELPALRTVLIARHGADEVVRMGHAGVQRAVQMTLRAGVCDIVPYPVDYDELTGALKRAQSSAAAMRAWARRMAEGVPATAGRVHAVTAARGGAGRTFLAINMAAYMSTIPDADVCIIDLDLPMGAVADALGIRPRFTLADVSDSKDLQATIDSYCEVHPMGFSVLAAPTGERAMTVSVDDALRVVQAAQRRFTHVVVDLPLGNNALAMAVLREATEKWCVLKADLPSLRTHAAMATSFERLGMDPTEVHVVLNMVENDGGITADDVDQFLPQGLRVALPYTRRAAQATNSARTILEVEPHGTLARRLRLVLAPTVPPESGVEAANRGSRRRVLPWRRS